MNHFGRRRERHRRNQDFIPRLDADRVQRQMKSRGAGVQRDGMGRTDIGRKFFFEFFRLQSRRQPAGAESLDHRLDLILADIGDVKGQKGRGRRHRLRSRLRFRLRLKHRLTVRSKKVRSPKFKVKGVKVKNKQAGTNRFPETKP